MYRLRTWLVVLGVLCGVCTTGLSGQSGIQYVYDEVGRLIAVIDPSGDTATYTYDAVGNILSIGRHATSTVSIISFTPKSGPAGTTVTIYGTGFSSTISSDSVSFNGTSATISSATTTQLVVTVPTGATTGTIQVTAPGGSATSANSFTVQALSIPTVTSFSPTIGVVDTAVTISGTNFDPSFQRNAVTLNGRIVPISGGTSTSLSSSLPVNGTTGHVTVSTTAGSGTSSGFLFMVPPPYAVSNVQYTGSMTTSSNASVSITTAGKHGLVAFDAVGGQLAVIQVTSNTVANMTVNLLSPSGSTVATSSISSQASFSLTAWLSDSGTYVLQLIPGSTASGSMTVALKLGSVPTSPPIRTAGSIVDATNSLANNMTGLFLMNEGTGTSVANALDGRVGATAGTTAPTWNTADPSLSFAGGGSLASYVNGGTDPTFDSIPTSKVTIVTKVYVNTVAAAGLCEKNDGNAASGGGFVFGFDANGALKLTIERSSTNMRVASANGAIVASKWLQVAFTWDGTVGGAASAHLFIDGIELPKSTNNDGVGTLTSGPANDKPFRIGNASYDETGSLNGKIAYVGVYRGRILTTSELASLDANLPLVATNVLPSSGSTVTSTATSAGQQQRFRFAAAATQSTGLQFTNNTFGSVTVTVLNPDQTTLTTLTSSASSFSIARQWLPAFGMYTVNVQPGGSATGAITANTTLADTPPRPTSQTFNSGSALATNLVGLYLMNEGSGTTDANVVNSNTASFSGTTSPSWNTSDPSVAFSGTTTSLSSYLNAGTDSAFNTLPTSKVTIVAKVWVTAGTTTVPAAGIAEKNDGNVTDTGFVFGWTSTGALKLTFEKTSSDMRVGTADAAVLGARWVQLAYTWDGTVGNDSGAHLFIDGVEQTKTSHSAGSGTLGTNNALPFRIGNASFDVTGSLNGKMAYLAVYKGRILTTTEMNQLDAQLPIH